MSDLLTKLIDLFQLDKINFTTANRKTLDEFLSKTEFQKRRQTLFEASCVNGKKKSRVALCKLKKTSLICSGVKHYSNETTAGNDSIVLPRLRVRQAS
jgi:hypothetical protein